MSVVTVLGGGGGGLSAVVELTQAGHEVRLWNRNERTIAPYLERQVPHAGVLGKGRAEPALVTTDLAAALAGAEVVVVCLPSLAHGRLFDDLAALGLDLPVVLNPGHTGGALHARGVFLERGARLPPLAELSTLTYVARVGSDATVGITGRAARVRAAALPGGSEALDWAQRLFPGADPVPDVLASSLSNVNLVLHPPGAVLGLAWVEATGGDFTFYVEGMTPAVAAVMAALDDERRAVARRFGHDVPSLLQEMAGIGTVEPAAAEVGDLCAAIRGGEANKAIRAPGSTEHRYYREDLYFGLLPFLALAEVGGVDTPAAAALFALGDLAVDAPAEARLDARALGVDGLTADELLAVVRP
ncbi:NAD/NADP-dependent octopine/nopaline dehydrogenase family protein [Nocardioides marmoribigeumensis]|uniref:Opine dehydrogenase n=1 Tax=Nocardioides marmoribigeumensis TaxID=433649 RepID=A0ABU2BUW6_9ACTN|nr:NAD/NADP octopine/nopaline dehydrogenase family protein [Nocardioides marmoribigeumensis]MDR7362427.1 opine dehydrogenase [Nocardioides marmoribigeumensis]